MTTKGKTLLQSLKKIRRQAPTQSRSVGLCHLFRSEVSGEKNRNCFSSPTNFLSPVSLSLLEGSLDHILGDLSTLLLGNLCREGKSWRAETAPFPRALPSPGQSFFWVVPSGTRPLLSWKPLPPIPGNPLWPCGLAYYPTLGLPLTSSLVSKLPFHLTFLPFCQGKFDASRFCLKVGWLICQHTSPELTKIRGTSGTYKLE